MLVLGGAEWMWRRSECCDDQISFCATRDATLRIESERRVGFSSNSNNDSH